MIPPLTTPDGRRALAFAAVVGGCIVMTIFAAVGVYLVRRNAEHEFYLALAAHAQIAIGLTALSALLVRRTIKAGKDGLEITDQESVPVTVTNPPSAPIPVETNP